MDFPIFVINMKSSKERWASTHSRLNELGLDAERWDATVGKALSSSEVSKWYDNVKNKTSHHRDLTAGEIGCHISHQRLWEKIVADNIPYALILEDDLEIDDTLPDILEAIQKLNNWELIKLFDNRDLPFIDSVAINNTFTLGNYLKVPNGCLGYILSLEGAKKLLKRQPFFRAVDIDIQFHSEVGINVTGIRPYPIREHANFDSDIEAINNGRHSNHSTFFRNLKYRVNMYLQRKKISANLTHIIK